MLTAIEEEKKQSTFLKEKLLQSGYRLTSQRQAVLDSVICNEGKHLSCEDVFQHVKGTYPRMSLSTVYRTIHLLADISLLSKIDFDDKCTRYELNIRQENSHCHLICLKCKKVSEVKEDLMHLLESLLYNKIRFTVKNRAVAFYGLCEQCSGGML